MDTNLCEANKKVSLEIKNFMKNVDAIKEESITDYLVWKWRELDQRFKYIKISTFTRQQENMTSGADFELELWLVGQKSHFPLVFQAKKFIKPSDSYIAKLNYPAKTQTQLKKLLDYAKLKKKIPFYAIYSIPDSNSRTMCCADNIADTSVFMIDAYTIKAFANGKYGTKVSRNKLLAASNPFHCMFCCPPTQFSDYFTRYFPALTENTKAHNNEQLPDYIKKLLSDEFYKLNEQNQAKIITENKLQAFRAIGVYDMREYESGYNPCADGYYRLSVSCHSGLTCN